MLSNNSEQEKKLIRCGALCAIAGAIIFMVANIIHPRSLNIAFTPAQIETVAASGIWVTDHLFLFLGGFLLLGGLMAIRRLVSSELGGVWAEFGYASAMVSTSVWTILMALDGITSKVVHNAWAMSPAGDKVVALHVAEMMEEIDIGIFSMYIIVFFGITLLFYGLAVAKSTSFPAWLGWVAVVLASCSLVVGVVQAYTGLSVLITNTLFASFSSLLTLWMLIMGFLTWRKSFKLL